MFALLLPYIEMPCLLVGLPAEQNRHPYYMHGSRRWIQSYTLMQGEEWVILLYLLPCEAEDKLKDDIIAALKPYVSLASADIHLTSRDDKYSAALRLPASKGKTIEDLREIRVGETLANIRRYYHDHQLYINRVPKDISPKEVSKYFSNFGTVLNVVLLPSLKTNEKYMHCYIKFEQSKSVDKVLLVRKLELAGREIRALRTFRIGESESTDKRLEVIIEPIPESIEVLENHINQHFQALAELRERVRLEADKRVCRGILAVTSKEKAAGILADFDPKAINKGLYAGCKIELKAWSPAVEQGGRVFAARLYRNVDEAKMRQTFEFYGEISDLTLTPNKTNSCMNAVITYSKKSSANLLLAEYLFNEEVKRLFTGKPLIEFYLNPSERLHYNNYLNKGKPQPQKSFNPIHINPNVPFNPPGQFIGYPPMQGMMPPPPFMPRPPNYPNPK